MKEKKTSHISPIHNSLFLKVILALFFLSAILVVENSSLISRKSIINGSNSDAKKQLAIIPEPSVSNIPTPTIIKRIVAPSPQQNIATDPINWGVAKQVGEHTYTIRVGMDEKMATPQEILQALNDYRRVHGSNALSWDNNLATYAQNRTDFFTKAGKLDAHSGFNSYLNNEDGFKKLGYYSLGENSSIGYKLAAVHLIEWVYASDQPHNENQLSKSWTNVGIGVSGTATDIIFGANHM